MQAQIRLAESGHSYHYSQLTTVHALMQEIRKDFKIELEDQKIIMKSGEILKSTMSFDSLQELMKKTIPTNNSTAFNTSAIKSTSMKEIQCLYIYNQKQLLKPIDHKIFNDESYLKVLRQKCNQMSSLAENSYEFKQFNQKVTEKNIISMIENINKKLKTPFQNIIQRYSRFYDNLNQRNYSKLQISSLLDLIQNQDKARKLLIRNIEYLFDRKTKKKLASIKQKVAKQTDKQSELNLRENSSFFSSQKGNYCSQGLSQLTRNFLQVELKCTRFYQKLKQSKKQVIKQKFLQQEKITFRIDKKATTIEKDYEQNIKFFKDYFDEFCEEIFRVNFGLAKTKEKDVKDLFKNLLITHEKIAAFQMKIEENIKEFNQMYLELSKIHMKGQTQNIKLVFEIYVELIKAYEDLDVQLRRFEKEISAYKQQKSQQVKVSQFSENKSSNMPLNKNIKSPKKQQKKVEKQQSQASGELQTSMPKINSPIKNKIGKNNLKSFNEEITSRNFELAIRQNKQLGRRLDFNRRLQGLVKYCANLCEKQQEMRRNFRNSKQFEENKIDLLGVYNVPTIQVDYNQTTDVELTHLYKKWMKENSIQFQAELNWENQLVEIANSLNRTLTTYLASKSNATQREKCMEKILGVLSDTFYKMMKIKLQKQTQRIRKTLKQEIQLEQKQVVNSLIKRNEELQEKLKRLEQNTLSIETNSQETDLQNSEFLSGNYQRLISKEKQMQEQNKNLRSQVKNLQEKLLSYQQQVNLTTQKLIESYEESNAQEVDKLSSQLRDEKAINTALSKQVRELKGQLQMGKTNLLKQFQTIQNLFKEVDQLTGLKEYYQKQFQDLKAVLADREVSIIRLQKHIEAINLEQKQSPNRESQQEQNQHNCQYKDQAAMLRQSNYDLEQEIENLDRELKEILFKETLDQQIQTDAYSSIQKGNSNANSPSLSSNQETSKLIDNKITSPNQALNQFATKQAHINNFGISNELNFNTEHQALSQYYVSSMGQQNWLTSFHKFTQVSIGKTIEQGMCHIFLPFSSDIYIGVTSNEDTKNYTSYQEYISQNMSENSSKNPIYILDLKQFNLKTNEMLRQCSLVLAVKVDKKQEISMGNKIMVSGKIDFALGFEDDDMTIKNYSHFLDQ